jgi:DNA transformation protein
MNARENPFVAHLLDLLAGLGPVVARSMFGGFGLYLDGVMFGLVADETFYLKTDALSRPRFEAAGLEPFVYEGRNRPVAMSYHEAPPAALDDPDELAGWARDAVAAAKRARAAKPSRRPAPRREGAKR